MTVPVLTPRRAEPPSQGGERLDEPAAVQEPHELAAVAVQTLAVPELVFALIALGFVAAAVWGAHPHLWWVAAFGAPLLGGGMAGLVVLSPSTAAWLLLALAAGNLAMEVLCLPGFILHATGCAVALALAGLSLAHPWSGAHPAVVIPGAALVGVATWWAASRSWRAHRIDPFHTSDRLEGRDLVILDAAEGNLGHAVVAGHLWTIRDPDRPLVAGHPARVTGQEAEVLTVRQRRARTRRMP